MGTGVGGATIGGEGCGNGEGWAGRGCVGCTRLGTALTAPTPPGATGAGCTGGVNAGASGATPDGVTGDIPPGDTGVIIPGGVPIGTPVFVVAPAGAAAVTAADVAVAAGGAPIVLSATAETPTMRNGRRNVCMLASL